MKISDRNGNPIRFENYFRWESHSEGTMIYIASREHPVNIFCNMLELMAEPFEVSYSPATVEGRIRDSTYISSDPLLRCDVVTQLQEFQNFLESDARFLLNAISVANGESLILRQDNQVVVTSCDSSCLDRFLPILLKMGFVRKNYRFPVLNQLYQYPEFDEEERSFLSWYKWDRLTWKALFEEQLLSTAPRYSKTGLWFLGFWSLVNIVFFCIKGAGLMKAILSFLIFVAGICVVGIIWFWLSLIMKDVVFAGDWILRKSFSGSLKKIVVNYPVSSGWLILIPIVGIIATMAYRMESSLKWLLLFPLLGVGIFGLIRIIFKCLGEILVDYEQRRFLSRFEKSLGKSGVK